MENQVSSQVEGLAVLDPCSPVVSGRETEGQMDVKTSKTLGLPEGH